MSCCIVLAPVVIASWPAIAGAIVAAATAMGYEMSKESGRSAQTSTRAALDLSNIDVLAESLGRGESVTVRKGAVVVTFAVDARRRFSCHVDGPLPKAELERIGKELGGAVIQQYVHRRLGEELAQQGFTVVQEERSEDRSIHVRVRRYAE